MGGPLVIATRSADGLWECRAEGLPEVAAAPTPREAKARLCHSLGLPAHCYLEDQRTAGQVIYSWREPTQQELDRLILGEFDV